MKSNNLDILIRGKGKPILFLPGFSLHPEMFDPVINELAKTYLVIVPDLTKLCSFSDLNNLIISKLKELKINSKIILFGHSMGGMLAVKFALKYKNKVEKLIILDGLLIHLKKTFFQTAGDIVSDTLYNIFDPNDWKNLFLSVYEHGKFFLKTPKIYKAQMDFIMSNTVENELSMVSVPTVIFWGQKDKVIPVENAEKIHKNIQGSKLEIIPGNHLWLLQKPILFKEKTDQFINEN